jgi:hypothetical protein
MTHPLARKLLRGSSPRVKDGPESHRVLELTFLPR